ncbi:hypothetical protein FHS32_006645 [Streptomyces albaduncus]|uniref:Uncharacterized protein n=1 Tax=Streptomyces griseoloalbus TaxID=67303 RepID=A0A7W8BWS7_9ACTN|nr:hypothetical protein [Streptomyces albaduncus]GGW76754.1 hypothetical protein GCM10010340_64280 [Streptomyces albaduncus]
MDEPTEPPPERQRASQDAAPCLCGSRDHLPLRVGERLSPSGAGIGGVYVCPAQSPAGLRGAL